MGELTLDSGISTEHPCPTRWRILLIFSGFLLGFGTWALASPLMSSPDEPAHVIRAAAVWSGQMRGDRVRLPTDPEAPDLEIYSSRVQVPRYYARTGEIPECFAGKPEVPASCSPVIPSDDEVVEAATTAGVYTPWYYALVGWPSAVLSSGGGVYLMRLMSVLLSAAFATLAVVVLSRILGERLALLGVWVAVTPMVYFLAGSVNPNGLESVVAVTAWCAALVVCSAAAEGRVDRLALWSFVVASVTLIPLRTLSPAYLMLIVVVAVAFGGASAVGVLARRREVWIAAVPVFLVTAGSVAWARSANQLGSVSGTYAPDDENVVIWLAGGIDDWVEQMMGVFGWLDTGPVKVTIVLWSLSLATLLVLSVMWARPWKLAGVLCLTIGTLVLPVAIQAPVAGEHGITWQGRYLLPVAVGVPLMALVSADGDGQLGRRVPLQRLFGLVLVVCGSALVVSHVVGMQRYVAGLASETVPGSGLVQNYLAADGWRPPVSKVLLLSSAILASLWPAIVLFVPAGRRQGTRPSTKPEEIPEDSAQDVGT